MQNEHGVHGFDEKDFSYNWLGAKVTFKLFGVKVEGTVRQVDVCYHTLDVELTDGNKMITVSGHFNCFRKNPAPQTEPV
jgi:hypothetical protein